MFFKVISCPPSIRLADLKKRGLLRKFNAVKKMDFLYRLSFVSILNCKKSPVVLIKSCRISFYKLTVSQRLVKSRSETKI